MDWSLSLLLLLLLLLLFFPILQAARGDNNKVVDLSFLYPQRIQLDRLEWDVLVEPTLPAMQLKAMLLDKLPASGKEGTAPAETVLVAAG